MRPPHLPKQQLRLENGHYQPVFEKCNKWPLRQRSMIQQTACSGNKRCYGYDDDWVESNSVSCHASDKQIIQLSACRRWGLFFQVYFDIIEVKLGYMQVWQCMLCARYSVSVNGDLAFVKTRLGEGLSEEESWDPGSIIGPNSWFSRDVSKI